jgi:hypothetical protein
MKITSTLALLLPALTGLAQTTLTNDGATLTVTSGATLYVAGSVQNNATGTLSNAGTVQLTGDLTNTGTLASPGTLYFNGSTDQTLTPGTATVANLTLDNAGNANANRLFLTQDLTVSTLLTLKQGLVRTLASDGTLRTLSLPTEASVVGEQAGRYVQGRLAVTRTLSGTGSVDFTNGFVLNPNGQTLGAVTVTRTAGLKQAGVSYGTNLASTTKGIDRVWQVVQASSGGPAVTTVTTATPASVTVSWVSDDDNGFDPNTSAQLWRADQASGPWVAQDAAGLASARSFTANTTQLGVLTISNASQPLPVQLVAFTAQRVGPDGLLSWRTAAELNNAYFQVESSVDGTTFQPLPGRVAGAGTSTLAHDYAATDKNLARYGAPLVYYRLRQVDANGASAYSPVRTVQVPQVAGLALFPNPTRAAATLTGATPGAAVQVFDAVGRLVVATQADAAGAAALRLPDHAARGVYVVRTGTQALRLSVAD